MASFESGSSDGRSNRSAICATITAHYQQRGLLESTHSISVLTAEDGGRHEVHFVYYAFNNSDLRSRCFLPNNQNLKLQS